MKIDLHIHTRTGSDGALSIDEVFAEAKRRGIDFMSITDHDSVDCQPRAIALARDYAIDYITGVELNVSFQYNEKTISLDFLGYQYDSENHELRDKLKLIKEHRRGRAYQILEKLNIEFEREGIARFTEADMARIQESVDGAFGRPHIADYLMKKGIVKSRQEAFDKYLVRCDVPKYPLSLAEASQLVRNAGGMLVLAHPSDPNGTSLVSVTRDLDEQTNIIKKQMLDYIDGLECWHSKHDAGIVAHYVDFARQNNLMMTGGSDCHQKPIIMGTLDVPDLVAEQFRVPVSRGIKA
ncbi:MAG: PHP domain-containing protein [Chloroflexi bacterium]|nr:PHP domain-containing protein [Chloroflexota bacterium]